MPDDGQAGDAFQASVEKRRTLKGLKTSSLGIQGLEQPQGDLSGGKLKTVVTYPEFAPIQLSSVHPALSARRMLLVFYLSGGVAAIMLLVSKVHNDDCFKLNP